MCLKRRRGEYGNGLLTRYGVIAVRRHDIGYPDREPRGVLDVDLDVDGLTIRVLVTHFGLSRTEREVQARRLAAVVREGPEEQPLVVMGDFNEWRTRPESLSALSECLVALPGLSSFPSTLPVFALDRIWVRPANTLGVVAAHRSNLARWASDHLPIAAELEFPAMPHVTAT